MASNDYLSYEANHGKVCFLNVSMTFGLKILKVLCFDAQFKGQLSHLSFETGFSPLCFPFSSKVPDELVSYVSYVIMQLQMSTQMDYLTKSYMGSSQ